MTPQVQIHCATRADLLLLHPVIERAYRGDAARLGWTHEADLLDGIRTDLETLQGIVDNEHLLIALDGETPIGCVQVVNKRGGLAYLGLLCVEPALQAADSASSCSRPPKRSRATSSAPREWK